MNELIKALEIEGGINREDLPYKTSDTKKIRCLTFKNIRLSHLLDELY